MITRRRLSLQLTPLLDLLLIVMFSQYIENRHRDELAQEVFAAERINLEQQLQEAKTEAKERSRKLDEQFQNILEQHHQAGSLLAESLNLPGAAMTEVLKLRTAGSPEDAQRLEDATKRLESVMSARGDEVFRFLTQVDEMQKHVAIWEVHVQQNGQVILTDGDQSFTTDFAESADFASRLFENSKSFADSRTLVILLLTWGDAQVAPRQAATDGMPQLTELLRKDAAGTRWFDFSIVGFRDDGAIFNERNAQ